MTFFADALGALQELTRRANGDASAIVDSIGIPCDIVADVVCAKVGNASPSGRAVLDPRTGDVYTSPAGVLASLDEVRACPDWVAAERHGDAWKRFSSGPHAMNFQIGDVCNAKCVMCWQALRREETERSEWRTEVKADMVEAALERHWSTLTSIELVSFGEPLLNPQFRRMVAAVRCANSRRGSGRPILLNLITNGSLLHRFIGDLCEVPGYMTVSIDAAHEELYERIRVGLSWQQVRANLELAARYPRRHLDRKVGVNFTAFEMNVHELPDMARLCVETGVRYLSVLHGAALWKTHAAGLELSRTDPRLVEGIRLAREAAPTLEINDYATERSSPALPAGTLPGRGFCPLPWRQYDVGPDGRAHPCCKSYQTDLGHYTEDIWIGAPLERLRAQILSDDVDPVEFADCARCDSIGAGVRGAKRLPVLQ